MVSGKMCCGVIGRDLVARVGRENHAEALRRPHTRPMDFTGRPLRGFVYVGPEGCRTARDLAAWVTRALQYVHTLPASVRKTRRRRTARVRR
jgi:hypothetical protein